MISADVGVKVKILRPWKTIP